MTRKIAKPKFKGQTIEFDLSQWGYKDYFVECTYQFNKYNGKYLLFMWLNRNDIEDRMRLSSRKIDAQYISGTPGTILDNVCRIVHYAANVPYKNGVKYFDKYVERYHYELACFERGNELFEQERMENSKSGGIS